MNDRPDADAYLAALHARYPEARFGREHGWRDHHIALRSERYGAFVMVVPNGDESKIEIDMNSQVTVWDRVSLTFEWHDYTPWPNDVVEKLAALSAIVPFRRKSYDWKLTQIKYAIKNDIPVWKENGEPRHGGSETLAQIKTDALALIASEVQGKHACWAETAHGWSLVIDGIRCWDLAVL